MKTEQNQPPTDPKTNTYQQIQTQLDKYKQEKDQTAKTQALENLLTMLNPLIKSTCKHYFGKIEEDQLQDGYEKAIRLINNYDPSLTNIKFLGYMKRMLMCHYWDQKKTQLKHQQIQTLTKQTIENPTSQTTANLTYQEQGYQTIELNDLLSILKEKEKQAITKTYLQGKKQKQVAQEMGISLAYTKELLQSAKKKLKTVTPI